MRGRLVTTACGLVLGVALGVPAAAQAVFGANCNNSDGFEHFIWDALP